MFLPSADAACVRRLLSTRRKFCCYALRSKSARTHFFVFFRRIAANTKKKRNVASSRQICLCSRRARSLRTMSARGAPLTICSARSTTCTPREWRRVAASANGRLQHQQTNARKTTFCSHAPIETATKPPHRTRERLQFERQPADNRRASRWAADAIAVFSRRACDSSRLNKVRNARAISFLAASIISARVRHRRRCCERPL